MKLSLCRSSAIGLVVLVFTNVVLSEPPTRNSGGWGQQQAQTSSAGGYSQQQQTGGYASQQQSGGYSSAGVSYGPPGGNYNNGGNQGGWMQQQQQQPQQQQLRNNGGWGGQAQAQQSQSNGGWGGQAQTQQSQSNGNGWGNDQNQMQKDQGNSGWSSGSTLNFELDTANLKNFNPANLFRSIIGIPRRIITFLRESGLYILLIPLLIILPLMLLAFNAGRLIGGLGWGWTSKRSLTADSGIIGFLKSPALQKAAEILMDERTFDRIMKSVEEFKKNCNRAVSPLKGLKGISASSQTGSPSRRPRYAVDSESSCK